MASRNGLPAVKHQSPALHLVAVGQFGGGKSSRPSSLNHRQIAGRIDADDHRVVQLAVGHAAFHADAGLAGDVKIRQRVAFRRDDHAGAAPLALLDENRQHRRHGLGDRRHAGGFVFQNTRRARRQPKPAWPEAHKTPQRLARELRRRHGAWAILGDALAGRAITAERL